MSWAWVCGGPCLQPPGNSCAHTVAPIPLVGICRAHTERATVCMMTRHSTGFVGLAALGTTLGEGHHPTASAQAMMWSPLDSYGGPCLQPPSTLAKHGACLPGTCPPTYVHSVFSPSLSSGRGRGIPPASCPRYYSGRG